MLFFRKKKKLSESSIVTKKCWRQHFREKRLLFTHLASHLSACKICTGVRGEKNIRCESILPMYLFYPWKKGWRSSFEGFKHCTAKKKCLFFLNCGHDVMNVSLTSLSLRPPLKHIDIQYVLWKYFHIFLSFFILCSKCISLWRKHEIHLEQNFIPLIPSFHLLSLSLPRPFFLLIESPHFIIIFFQKWLNWS